MQLLYIFSQITCCCRVDAVVSIVAFIFPDWAADPKSLVHILDANDDHNNQDTAKCCLKAVMTGFLPVGSVSQSNLYFVFNSLVRLKSIYHNDCSHNIENLFLCI